MQATHKSAWERAADSGVDMSLIEANLRRSVAERLHRHDAALNTIRKLRAAVKQRDERAD